MAAAMMLVVAAGCEQYTTAPAFQPVTTPAGVMVPTGEPTALNADVASSLIVSVEEDGYAHLFLFSPSTSMMTRLTGGEWSDITPAISPDGRSLAFASNRSGV